MKSFAAAGLAAALFASQATAALQPIVIKGSHFFYENGTEFFIKGIAYQQDYVTANGTGTAAGGEPDSFTDPLADEAGCRRDVPLLKELGVNAIRVYAIEPTSNHDVCMKLLDDAGIYLIQDLSNPHSSINRNDPAWNTDLYKTYTAVIDALAKYDNVMGFFAGNEVSNIPSNTNASAFVKAAVRDSKAYIKQKKYRQIGVGYATNDDAEIRDDLKDYFNCGTPESSIDFWGYNIYSWCGQSSFTRSGFDQRTLEFAKYNVPAFFAEYGCNEVQPRPFTEVGALYGDQMTNVWSGGIMYMYFQERNDYGVVEVKNGAASKLADFDTLKTQLAKAKPSNTAMSAYQVTNTAAASCPAATGNWQSSEKLPPIVNPELCECMVKSLSCTVADGLEGEDIGDLFGQVCGLNPKACEGIARKPSTGVYGAYSMCTGEQQLAFALDQYYQLQKKAKDACDFGGKAKLVQGSASGNCGNLVKAAGTAGTSTVTAVPGNAAAAGTGAASGSSPSGSTTGTGNAAASVVPAFNTGLLAIGAYLVVAGATGMGMILL